MRDAAVVMLMLIAGTVTCGWPDSAHAQSVGQADSRHGDDAPTQQPPPSATAQPNVPPSEQGTTQPITPIPPVTDADRAAAFPDVQPHSIGDDAMHYFVLVDQLEWQAGDAAPGMTWDSAGWVGTDLNRLWFRTEGEAEDGRLGGAEAHLFYGRAIARWWDVVIGLRQNLEPGPAQSWFALGVQGLAPYWFEIEATAYLGAGGRTAARLEAEYELLLTNHLVFQPLVEVNLYGKTDSERRIGAGLSTFEAGFRVRYEVRRELAPYLGVTWVKAFGDTADLASAAGESARGRRYVAGLRLWF